MKTWLKVIFGVILIIIGFAAIVFGEIDDSPGLMLIGFILIVGTVFILVRRLIKYRKMK